MQNDLILVAEIYTKKIDTIEKNNDIMSEIDHIVRLLELSFVELHSNTNNIR